MRSDNDPYVQVCKDTDIHIWNEVRRSMWEGDIEECIICGKEKPELTDEEWMKEMN